MTNSPRLYGLQLWLDETMNEVMLWDKWQIVLKGELTSLPVLPLVYAYLKPDEDKGIL